MFMSSSICWSPESDSLLKYLYEDLKILNWVTISQEMNSRLGFQTDSTQCRNRFVEKYGITQKEEWTIEQEKELYRLHNQNGNKWAVISQNLLGRNDNCVKNHFYSKLRKSLRTLNKIAKLYLKKQVKQISDLVLYKLTEVTDQSLKPDTEVSKKTIQISFEIKNKLLSYQMDQKDIKDSLDYAYQKQLLLELAQFNRIYKKKPKKQKATALGNQNLKKMKKKEKKNLIDGKNKDQIENNQQFQSSQQNSQQKIQEKNKFVKIKKNIEVQPDQRKNKQQIPPRKASELFSISHSFYNIGESGFHLYNLFQQPQTPRPKKTVNLLIKAPSQQQKLIHEGLSFSSLHQEPKDKITNSDNFVPYQEKPKTRVEDILKAQGILQNGDYGNGNQNYFRRTNSQRSFSVCSQSSNPPDMFGQGVVFLNDFKEVSQMENQSQLFTGPQNQ